jgi:transposase InsO family protein
MLNIIDEYTRECLAIRVDRKITASDVIDTLADVFIRRGMPQFIRSDNGHEFVAEIIWRLNILRGLLFIMFRAD